MYMSSYSYFEFKKPHLLLDTASPYSLKPKSKSKPKLRSKPSKKPAKKESYEKMDESFATQTDLGNVYDIMTRPENARRYDMDSKIIPKTHPDYVPSIQEAAIQDSSVVMSQTNTTFLLTAVAGTSLVLFGYMFASSE